MDLDYEGISILIQCFNILILVAGLFFVFIQIRQNTKVHKDNHDWNRRIASHNALTEIFSKKILLIRSKILEYVSEKEYFGGNYLNISEKFSEDEHKLIKSYIIDLLRNYSLLSLQINNNVFDEHICYQLAAYSCVKDHQFCRPFINSQRVERNEVHLYIDFTSLAEKWEKKMKEKSEEYSNKVVDAREYKKPIE